MGKNDAAKNAGKDRVSFIHSLSFKMIMLIVICTAVSVVTCLTIVVNKSKSELKDTTHNYLLYMAEAERNLLNQKTMPGVGADFFASMLSDVAVEGCSSSYAYLVSSEGVMLYHPTADKVGQPVENAVVTGLVADIKAGNTPEDSVAEYEYKGAVKYSAYAITKDNQILVITADEKDILGPIDDVRNIGIIVGAIFILVSLIAAYVLCKFAMAPLEQLADIIEDTAQFNFRHNPNSGKLCKRKDESGVMARAIANMRASLRSMIINIEQASQKIDGNVEQLSEVTNVVNSMCTDNSATTEELAAGMQETAATTESIYANIGYMQTGAHDITQLSENGDALSDEVMERATALRSKTLEATDRTKSIYDSVKVRSDNAIEDSKAVQKINELTEAIMAISSQTSLLALNASIEAARAGEAGKGFAVVATEIGNLATQTSQAVGDINVIVSEVNKAVANMAGCLEETGSFLEDTVLADYRDFESVAEQYSEDASKFKESMRDVRESIINLTDSIAKISDAISGINATVGESTLGVTDIAGKTTDMVTRTSETSELVEESRDCVVRLRSIVDEFQMDEE